MCRWSANAPARAHGSAARAPPPSRDAGGGDPAPGGPLCVAEKLFVGRRLVLEFEDAEARVGVRDTWRQEPDLLDGGNDPPEDAAPERTHHLRLVTDRL